MLRVSWDNVGAAYHSRAYASRFLVSAPTVRQRTVVLPTLRPSLALPFDNVWCWTYAASLSFELLLLTPCLLYTMLVLPYHHRATTTRPCLMQCWCCGPPELSTIQRHLWQRWCCLLPIELHNLLTHYRCQNDLKATKRQNKKSTSGNRRRQRGGCWGKHTAYGCCFCVTPASKWGSIRDTMNTAGRKLGCGVVKLTLLCMIIGCFCCCVFVYTC